MKLSYHDGYLTFSVEDLFDDLSLDTLNRIIDQLACQDAVIDQVARQILVGWTELGSHGAISPIAEVSPKGGIDLAIREVSRRANEVAKCEISRLEAALLYVKKENQELLKRRQNET